MASIITKATQAILLTLDKHQRAAKVSTFQKTGQLTPEEVRPPAFPAKSACTRVYVGATKGGENRSV